ncbi:unnamed protein product [Orchesella dallaii]|uniref:Uncharacterized protein n=1 Tax=Orchesella dallaii TaxID=48710 RepID=A0ABP1PR15_9HEXA
MASLILEETHNLTLPLYQSVIAAKNKFKSGDPYATNEMINTITRVISPSFYLVSQMLFGRFDAASILYCDRLVADNNEEVFKFSTWYGPFSLRIWMIMASVAIFVTIANFKDQRQKVNVFFSMLDHFGNVLGQGASPKKRNMIAIGAFGFLLTQLYSNELTSLVTVATPPKGIKSIEDPAQ